jgi:hypothetical protein
MWFVNNIQRIVRWVNAVMDSLGNIAAGAVSAAIGFIVNGMKIIIPVILDFFARLLNISGIVDAVKKIIDKIAGPIHAAINKVIDWIVGWVKKMFGKGGDTDAKKSKEATKEKTIGEHDTEVGKVVNFTSEGEQHHIWIAVKEGNVEVMVASDPSPVIRLLEQWAKEATEKNDEEKIKKAKKIYSELMLSAQDTEKKILEAKKSKDEKKAQDAEKSDTKVEEKEAELAKVMAELFIKFGTKKYKLDSATIAEAHGKFQAITDKANSFVGSNVSNLREFGLLSKEQITAAYETLTIKKKGPWLYWAFYGTAVEKQADRLVDNSKEFETISKGGNYPDFKGKKGGKYGDLVFDITTTNQGTIDSHVGRTRDKKKSANYNNVIITIYSRGGKDKEWQIVKAMNQEINKSTKEEDIKE